RRAADQRKFRLQALVAGVAAAEAGIIVLGVIAWVKKKTLRGGGYSLANRQPLSVGAERGLKAKDSFKECGKLPGMIRVGPGEFMMGSPPEEKDREPDEDRHKVAFAKPFAVSKYAVTFDEWDLCESYGDCDHAVDDVQTLISSREANEPSPAANKPSLRGRRP